LDGGIEVRADYFEYYTYKHSQVLKDGIEEPYFLFGTTGQSESGGGKDIFACLAYGARFSFIFATIVAVTNFIVGVIYGSIAGYFGGKVDLFMERFSEILGSVPTMIVITLLKYHMGGSSQALILFISFFMTGWMGMAGTTRMQFYRYKNQEYVVAARTLGASDRRIMFKHIFPNGLGTIVTAFALLIPSMIYSETNLSYLGIIDLESGNTTSVGTLIAAGQRDVLYAPYVAFFPCLFLVLLMLSFNLFGNGLRDAFNPSLRGAED
jgi:oligopeptide transport system permease protein